jgi:hypothetical protein
VETLRPIYHEVIAGVVREGEIVSACDVVSRLMDNGYKSIPTSASVAYTMSKSPAFEPVLDTRLQRKHYRRREY